MNSEYYGVRIIPVKDEFHAFGIAHYIAQDMRDADKEELKAQGLTPFEGVFGSMDSSIESFFAVFGSKVLCAFGIADTGNGISVWMLASKEVDKHRRALSRCGMDYIKDKLKEHHELTNYISRNNAKALCYIKHAGAVFDAPVTVNGVEFVRFTIKE